MKPSRWVSHDGFRLRCSKCKEEKPRERFSPSGRKPGDRNFWCRDCQNQRDRDRRAGLVHKSEPLSRFESFWRRVRLGDGCWEWTASRWSGDYGAFTLQKGGVKRCVRAHRMAYEMVNGPIPAGMLVCHRCDNRRCVRPGHMFLGTQADNMRDMAAKGRGNAPRKLSEEQVREARALRAAGVPFAKIAARFGVARWTIQRLTNYGGWKNVA